MKKRIQGVVLGIIIGCVLSSGIVFAENIQKSLNAIYMNIKLVIDGVEITPKDVNGNVVEPFIYNGTTYLPVRAIGEAFGKDVNWDGDTATVYVGKVVKPAKEVYLYDKPYLGCAIPAEFIAGKSESVNVGSKDFKRAYQNYIGFNLSKYEKEDADNYYYTNYVSYALNGTANKVKGTFVAPAFSNCDSAEYQVKFYNESGKLLYQSPIMTSSLSPVDFEFEPGNALQLKVEFNGHSDHGTYKFYCVINDFAIYTTDY